MKPTNVTGYPFSNGDRLTAVSVNQICNALDAIQDYNDTIKEFEDLVEENTEEIKQQISATTETTVNTIQGVVQDPASVTAITSELAAGKAAIADAITEKGGTASATESFSGLAQDIQSMEIQQVTIDGGQMYANQMTGNGVLWDLYTILVQMKSQFMVNGYSYNGVLYKYSALIVCEYYKGYDSLVLQGADAYFTCDGDFYNYASPNHIWHDSDNGKMNRWVCFLFTAEGARLDITNTAISPRSMYIGGRIGTIEYFVNGRLTELVSGVDETDIVDKYIGGSYTQAWGKNLNLTGIKDFDKLAFNGQVFASVRKDTVWNTSSQLTGDVQYLYVDYRGGAYSKSINPIGGFTNLIGVVIRGNIKNGTDSFGSNLLGVNDNSLRFAYFPETTGHGPNFVLIGYYSGTLTNLEDVMVGAFTTNLKINRWNPDYLSDAARKATLIANIKNHILARVSDATGGTQLVFTVSTNMYNAIANENIEWQGETMTLADAFLTKNWLLAGA